jgi:3-oxoacyl-[acyl-carrier-protein] synthase II
MGNRVVVTGIGLVTPLNPFESCAEFWRSLCEGRDAVRKIPAPLLNGDRKWLMADIDMPEHVRPEDKICHLASAALEMALKDSAIAGCPSAGLCLGTVLGNILSKETRCLVKNRRTDSMSSDREQLSYLAAYLSAKFNLSGTCLTISTACASGTDAIGVAARKISDGQTEIMIAGGADVLSDFALFGFNALQALTHDKVRPFDRNRTGLALGEGAAFLVLESERHASRRGANIYGRILGYASRADAHHLTAPHREGRGLAEAASIALKTAAVGPGAIHYINAHGTGTSYNDLMETVVIKKVLGKHAYSVPVSSTKSMLGHSFGAAGAIEAICCLLAINNNRIPPTINYEDQDPECDLDYVPNRFRYHDVQIAMSFSAGFGGQNSVLVMGRA